MQSFGINDLIDSLSVPMITSGVYHRTAAHFTASTIAVDTVYVQYGCHSQMYMHLAGTKLQIMLKVQFGPARLLFFQLNTSLRVGGRLDQDCCERGKGLLRSPICIPNLGQSPLLRQ